MSITYGAAPRSRVTFRVEAPPVFEPDPVTDSILPFSRGHWVWEDVEIRQVDGMRGLFAKRSIEPGLVIPYIGHLMPTSDDPQERLTPQSANVYVADDVDANPMTVPACMQGYCISSFINEPRTGQYHNCTLQSLEGSTDSDAIFRNADFKHWDSWYPFILVMNHVPAGQELLVDYTKSYQPLRTYKDPGRATPCTIQDVLTWSFVSLRWSDIVANGTPLPVTFEFGNIGRIPDRPPDTQKMFTYGRKRCLVDGWHVPRGTVYADEPFKLYK